MQKGDKKFNRREERKIRERKRNMEKKKKKKEDKTGQRQNIRAARGRGLAQWPGTFRIRPLQAFAGDTTNRQGITE